MGKLQKLPPEAEFVKIATVKCRVCQRGFAKDRIQKHEVACKKLAASKRKTFDTGKQRAGPGSDVSYANIQAARKEQEKLLKRHGGHFPPPKTNWKERHEDFIGAVSSAKHVDSALKNGTPLPPPPPSKVPSDYVQCDFCGRNFNSTAAERHIPFCREQNKNKSGPKGPSAKASNRLNPKGSASSGRPSSRARGKSPAPSSAGSTLAKPRGSSIPRSNSFSGKNKSELSAPKTGAKRGTTPNRGRSPATANRMTKDMKKLGIKK